MPSITDEGLRRIAIEIIDSATDPDRDEHLLSIVQALFCAMRHINDVRNLPGDKTPESKIQEIARENNVELVQARF